MDNNDNPIYKKDTVGIAVGISVLAILIAFIIAAVWMFNKAAERY